MNTANSNGFNSNRQVAFNMLMPEELRNYIKDKSKSMGISESLLVREILKTIMQENRPHE